MSQTEKTFIITEYQLEELTKSLNVMNKEIRNAMELDDTQLENAFDAMQNTDSILTHIRGGPAK